MKTQRALAAVCATAVTLVVTACSGGGQAAPPPDGTGQSGNAPAGGEPPRTALPHSGAPKVASPLPASVFGGGPCTALDPRQVTMALGTDVAGRPDQNKTGPMCEWVNQETGAEVSVGFITETHQGLSGPYQNTKPQSVVWRELPPIQGFPAVAHVTPAGGPPDEFCAVSVGIVDDLSFDVSAFLSWDKKGKVDPCDAVARLAGLVVTTLRQKAGA